MVKCPYCGAENLKDYNLCVNCSKPLDKNNLNGMLKNQQSNQSKKQKFPYFLIILIAIITITGLVALGIIINIFDNIQQSSISSEMEYFNVNISCENQCSSYGEIMYEIGYKKYGEYYTPSIGSLWRNWYNEWPPYYYPDPYEDWIFSRDVEADYDYYNLKIEWYDEGDGSSGWAELYPTDTAFIEFNKPDSGLINFRLIITENSDLQIELI